MLPNNKQRPSRTLAAAAAAAAADSQCDNAACLLPAVRWLSGCSCKFHIQGDFLLPSSREGLLEDSAYNMHLRDQVGCTAFCQPVACWLFVYLCLLASSCEGLLEGNAYCVHLKDQVGHTIVP
jgi:hypothetical protein